MLYCQPYSYQWLPATAKAMEVMFRGGARLAAVQILAAQAAEVPAVVVADAEAINTIRSALSSVFYRIFITDSKFSKLK